MVGISRWDPFYDLRSVMDDLFAQGFSRPWRALPMLDYESTFPIDILETDEAVEVKAALPGYGPDEVDITVTGDALTIRAQHIPASEGSENGGNRNTPQASLARSFTLPVMVDAEKAEATYEYGMLYLTLPKAESVRPKQIRIGTRTEAIASPEPAAATA